MKTNKVKTLIVGPFPIPPFTGGIGSYLNGLRDSACFRKLNIDYLNTAIPRPFKNLSFLRWLVSLGFFLKLLAKLLTFRYRLVHLHASAGISFLEKSLMLICCRLFGARTVIHLHSGIFPQFYEKTWLKGPVSFFLDHADAVFAVSAESGDFLESITDTPVYTVPNCVHPCFFEVRPRQDISRNLLYTGHVEPEKGIFELIQAVDLLRKRGYDGRVVLAGGQKSQGSLSRVRNCIAKAELEDVEMPGELTPGAIAELCRLSGIFVLPSHGEGQPVALLEAMAAGLAVVATRVGGIPDIVIDGENGLLVPPRNPEQLAEKINTLLEDPGLCRRMGEQNRRQMLETHHADRVGETVAELYRSILAPESK
jgi:glycosyltransferase involved in cell wall biosynthesis